MWLPRRSYCAAKKRQRVRVRVALPVREGEERSLRHPGSSGGEGRSKSKPEIQARRMARREGNDGYTFVDFESSQLWHHSSQRCEIRPEGSSTFEEQVLETARQNSEPISTFLALEVRTCRPTSTRSNVYVYVYVYAPAAAGISTRIRTRTRIRSSFLERKNFLLS